MSQDAVVILGAGHAGGSVAAFLRQYGHEGPITLVGDEPIAPYRRPPHGIDFKVGARAAALDRVAQTAANIHTLLIIYLRRLFGVAAG